MFFFVHGKLYYVNLKKNQVTSRSQISTTQKMVKLKLALNPARLRRSAKNSNKIN